MALVERRIIVRCSKNPKHAKVIRFTPVTPPHEIREYAAMLDGSSRHFIHKPGPESPVGKCATCGAAVECKIEDIHDGKDV